MIGAAYNWKDLGGFGHKQQIYNPVTDSTKITGRDIDERSLPGGRFAGIAGVGLGLGGFVGNSIMHTNANDGKGWDFTKSGQPWSAPLRRNQ